MTDGLENRRCETEDVLRDIFEKYHKITVWL